MLSADRQLMAGQDRADALPSGRMGGTVERLAAALRQPAWLTADWISRRARVLLTINLLLAVGVFAIAQRPVPGGHAVSVDFVSFYAAGDQAGAGQAPLAYDHAAHLRAEAAASSSGGAYQFFFYPPPFLLLCQALSALPYPLAFAAFEAVTLAVFLLVIRGVAGPLRGRAWLLPVLAFSPIFWTLAEGQNALLTAALLGAATLLIDRRPLLAGILFGALCYKPHLGVLVPVALLAGQRWRAIAGAIGSAGGLIGLSWLLYGTATWRAYLVSFFASGEVYGSGQISFAGMVSPFGSARVAGLATPPALALQLAASLVAVAAVARVWRCGASRPVRAAALLAGTMIVVPVVLLYDQTITLMALAWLARQGMSEGFLSWEKLILTGCFALAVIGFPLAAGLGLPVGAVPAAMLLTLCAVRAGAVRPALAA